MKNRHTAVDPDGGMHVRNSDNRVYTHTVVAKRDRAYELSQLNVVSPYGRDRWLSYQARGLTEYMDGHTSVEQYEDEVRARQHTWFQDVDAKGYFSRWVNLGWNGRIDLAEKLKASSASPHYAQVVILEAQMVRK